jgi:hypothetical protein
VLRTHRTSDVQRDTLPVDVASRRHIPAQHYCPGAALVLVHDVGNSSDWDMS